MKRKRGGEKIKEKREREGRREGERRKRKSIKREREREREGNPRINISLFFHIAIIRQFFRKKIVPPNRKRFTDYNVLCVTNNNPCHSRTRVTCKKRKKNHAQLHNRRNATPVRSR